MYKKKMIFFSFSPLPYPSYKYVWHPSVEYPPKGGCGGCGEGGRKKKKKKKLPFQKKCVSLQSQIWVVHTLLKIDKNK